MSLLTTYNTDNSYAQTVASEPIAAEAKWNVPYDKDVMQRMDIYLPVNRSTQDTKSMILIHGGGWNSGDKNNFAHYIDTFKKRLPNYAIFNINYRLVANNYLFPTQEVDVKAAVDFIVGHAEEYSINKDKLVLLGASAGAHLALLQAYKYPEPKIKAVIDFFGPSDLTAMYHKPWHPMIPYLLQMLTGATPISNPHIYHQSSPVYFVDKHSAPTLILQGGKDNIIDPSQSELLKERLDSAGVANDMVIYPSERHGWFGPNLTDSFDRIIHFLQAHLS